MVIQRIQSVFLLLAALVMGCLCAFVPLGWIGEAGVYVYDIYSSLVLNATVGLLLFIDIFLFKNLKFQIKVTRMLTWLVVCALLLTGYVIMYKLPEGGIPCWWLPVGCIVIAWFLTLCALSAMKRDMKLLRSYDRLR